MLTAKYVPTQRTVRMGVPTKQGAIDCGIDYPADLDGMHQVLDTLHHYATSHQQALRSALRAGPRLRKAA